MQHSFKQRHSFKRALAVLLSILLVAGNLGLTAFAEGSAPNPGKVPDSDDAGVSAALAEPSNAEGVPYLDADGETAYCADYTLLTGSETAWSGWYVADSAVNIGSRVTVSGEAHLILADGAALTIPKGITVTGTDSLTVYAQSVGDSMGVLTINSVDEKSAGIGGYDQVSGGGVTVNGGRITVTGGRYSAGIGGGNYGAGGITTINGGTVEAQGGYDAAGIGGGSHGSGGEITIRGGQVTANGGNYAASIGGGSYGAGGVITISGGQVTANASYAGAGIGGGTVGAGGKITISGGQVTANGGNYAAGIGGGYNKGAGEITIRGGKITANGARDGAGIGPGADYSEDAPGTLTMGLSAADESIQAGSYRNNSQKYPSVTVEAGCFLKDSSGMVYSGTLSNAMLDGMAGMELRKATNPHAVSVSVTGNGTVTPSQAYAEQGAQITLTVTPWQGSVLERLLVNGSDVTAELSNGSYSFPMPDADVAVSAAFAVVPGAGFRQTGENEYVIYNDAGWQAFAASVNNGNSYSGCTVYLDCDVNVSQKVGVVSGSSLEKPFSGVFDGNNHTVTAAISDSANQGTAPFCWINGATVKNLNVVGSVTGTYHAAAIVGFATGSGNRIEDCTASATVDGGGSHVGGILGHGKNSSITIEDCLFSGLMMGSNPKGAIFGWGDSGGEKYVVNCLYLMAAGQSTENLDLAQMNGGSVNITHSFRTCDGSYGDRASVTAPSDRISRSLTVCDTAVFAWATVEPLILVYTGAPIPVTPVVTWNGTTLTPGTDFSFTIEGVAGQAVTEPGVYTLLFTGAGDYQGSQTGVVRVLGSVPYLDAEGETAYRGDYTPLTGSETAWSGWYVAEGTVNIGSRVTVSGEAHLILADGAALTIPKGVTVTGNNSLTIYAQSTGDGMGALTINGVDESNAGIGGAHSEGGVITINGGKITATGGVYAAGIGGGDEGSGGKITIQGGKVTATGGHSGGTGIGGGFRGTGGEITVSGGEVTANGDTYGAGIGGGAYSEGGVITINGGQVTATGGDFGAGIGGGYYASGGEITVSGGQVTAIGGEEAAGIGGGYYASGGEITVSGGNVTANGGGYAAGIGGGYNGAGGEITISGGTVTANGDTDAAGIGPGRDYPGNAPGTLTMSLSAADEFIKVSSYKNSDNQYIFVIVEEGCLLKDGSGNVYSGTLSNADLDQMAGAELRMATPCPWNMLQLAICRAPVGSTLSLSDFADADRRIVCPADGNPLTINKEITLDLRGCVLDRHLSEALADGYVIHITANGSLTLVDSLPEQENSLTVSGEPVTVMGGVITGGNNTDRGNSGGGVYNEGAFTLSGGTICGNTAAIHAYGGGVYNTGSFTMSGGTICGNTSDRSRGGGVYNTGTFSMSGSASVTGNTANNGCGVYNTSTFTMTGGASVTGNTGIAGGGVYNIGDGTFIMSDSASVAGNTGTIGGGVRNAGAFTMSGSASVSGNTGRSFGGGVFNSGTFTMSGSASVTWNTCGNICGGVYNDGAFTMTDSASVTGNTANSGGGVLNLGDSTFTMSGSASVTGNTANRGGGVLNDNGSTFTMSGSPRITGNKVGEAENNVFLHESANPISFAGALTGDARIGVSMEAPGVFTDGLSGNGTAASFISDDDAYRVRVNGSGEAELFSDFATYQVLISSVGGTVTADRGTGSGPRAAEGDVVTLTIVPNPGYAALASLTVNGVDVTAAVSDGCFSFPMPAGDVTVTAAFAPDPAHFSANAAETEYTIHSAEGWDVFCDLLENKPKGCFDGKTVVLGDSISVSRMAGLSGRDFTGVFDGGGKTLTFTATAAEHYCAPFRYVQGASAESKAVIRNLKVQSLIDGGGFRHSAGLIAMQSGYVDVIGCDVEVTISDMKNTDANLYPAGLVSQANSTAVLTVSGCTVTGTISTDAKYAAGLIGIIQGSASIEDSVCGVTINSATEGDGSHGGLVGVNNGGCTLSVQGCVFNGSLLGDNTNKVGGFVGWSGGSTTISDSLFAPAELSVQEEGSAAFARNGAAVTNSYYTQALGEAQGKLAHTVSPGAGVTLGLAGTLSVYEVSGLTVSDARVGLQSGDAIYAAAGEELSILLNCAYPTCSGYSVNAGTLSGTGNPYTLVMPAQAVRVEARIDIPFTDVEPDDYFYGPVLWAVYHEPPVTQGVSETRFGPHLACTRAQIVTFLWRAAGSPEPTLTESPFSDVRNPNAYYYQAVLWAYENGITVGVSASAFGVNQSCSRAQVVTFLWRLAGSPEPESMDSPFGDVQNPNAWYYKAVLWAAENQITAGTAPNVFSPGQTCTRAQVVTFLYSYCTGNDAAE